MRLAIFSEIVTGGVPFSYWLIFSLVSCNYPRSLCENEFVPVTLSFLKWRILKERTELENQSDVLFIQAKKPSAPAPLPLVIEVSQKRESVKISSNLKHSCLYVYVSLCCFQGFRSLNFHSHRGRSPYSRRSHKALRWIEVKLSLCEYLYEVSESRNSRKTLPLVYGNAAVNSSCIHVLFGYVWAFLTKTKQNDNPQNSWGRQNNQYSEQMRVVAGVQRGKVHTTRWWPVLVLHQFGWFVSLSQSRDNNIVRRSNQWLSIFIDVFIHISFRERFPHLPPKQVKSPVNPSTSEHWVWQKEKRQKSMERKFLLLVNINC